MTEASFVALGVATIMGPLVVVIQKLRRENTDQHAEGRALIHQISNQIGHLGEKIDSHIGWHDGVREFKRKSN